MTPHGGGTLVPPHFFMQRKTPVMHGRASVRRGLGEGGRIYAMKLFYLGQSPLSVQPRRPRQTLLSFFSSHLCQFF